MARGQKRLRTADGKLNQIGERVRERRDGLKLTQDALCARLSGVTEGLWIADRMELYRIECGTRIVSDLELFALAKALECRVEWILMGAGTVAT